MPSARTAKREAASERRGPQPASSRRDAKASSASASAPAPGPDDKRRSKGAIALRAYLDQHEGLSHSQLAEKIGCARSHVGMLLSGTAPSLSFAARIERELGIPCIDWTHAA